MRPTGLEPVTYGFEDGKSLIAEHFACAAIPYRTVFYEDKLALNCRRQLLSISFNVGGGVGIKDG
jgi:hypothetical protein